MIGKMISEKFLAIHYMLCLNFGSHQDVGVFPTFVGVFQKTVESKIISDCLPHVRGGVSTKQLPQHRSI